MPYHFKNFAQLEGVEREKIIRQVNTSHFSQKGFLRSFKTDQEYTLFRKLRKPKTSKPYAKLPVNKNQEQDE